MAESVAIYTRPSGWRRKAPYTWLSSLNAPTNRSNYVTCQKKMKPLASELNQRLPSVYRSGEATT